MLKRLTSMILVLALALTMLPVSALAEATEPEETQVQETEAEVTEPGQETTVPTEAVTEPTEPPAQIVTEPVEETSPTEEPPVIEVVESTNREAADSAVASGKCGKSLTWELDSEGTLTISGVGAMDHYGSEGGPWRTYKSKLRNVVIEEGVTGIGKYMCNGFTNLVSVSIPSTVTSIGYYAFMACSNLEKIVVSPLNLFFSSDDYGILYNKNKTTLRQAPGKITGTVSLPESVTLIDWCAFDQCRNMTGIVIPDGVETIEYGAFEECTGLSSVTLPDSVTKMGERVFFGCTGLVSAVLSKSLAEVPDWIFYGCTGLKEISIPATVTGIGEYAFFECSGLTEIKIPANVTSIGEHAFYECSALASVTLPGRLTEIATAVFAYCTELNHVAIPSSVTSIGERAFEECISLTSISIPASVTSIGDSAFYNCTRLSDFSLPNGLKTIGNWAFYNCAGLTNVKLPDTITQLGDGAFENCTGLTDMVIPYGIEYVGSDMFSGCTALESITIPDSVTSIGYDAFEDCTALTSITIPDSVTSIDFGAFGGCSNLTSIKLSENLTAISSRMFGSCESLAQLKIPKSVRKIEGYAFSGCEKLHSIVIPSNVTELGNFALSSQYLKEIYFEGYAPVFNHYVFDHVEATVYHPDGHVGTSWDEDVKQDHYGTITWQTWTPQDSTLSGTCCDTVSWILDGAGMLRVSGEGELNMNDVPFAFSWDNYKEQVLAVEIGEGITRVENACFSGCTNMKSVTLSSTVTSLGRYAFDDCNSLQGIVIPSTVTSIDAYAFANCWAIDEIYIPAQTRVGSYAFDGTYGLTIYHGSKKPIYTTWNYNNNSQSYIMTHYGWSEIDYSFWKNDAYKDPNATEIILPDGIQVIPDNAFYNLYKLVRVHMPESVYKIGRSAFAGTSLESIDLPAGVEEIGLSAFDYCKFTSITIPAATTFIGSDALYFCSKLTSIDVDPANETYCSIDGVLFSKDEKKLVSFPRAKQIPIYTVPGTVEQIGSDAFRYAWDCKGVILPEGLKSIGTCAFCNSGITFLNIPKTVQVIDAYVADGSELAEVYFDGTDEEWNAINIYPSNDGLFNAMRRQETLGSSGVCGEGVKWEMLDKTLHIYGSGAMRDYSADSVPWKIFRNEITRISIDEGVYRVGDFAFTDCKNMTILQIPSSLNSIGTSALQGCRGIRYILDLSHKENKPQRFLGALNMEWDLAEQVLLGLKDYVTNTDIRINRSGYAKAFYAGIPNEKYVYSVGETTAEVVAGEDGIVAIPLGGFGAPGTYPVTVKISQVGDHTLMPAMELYATVVVTPLQFTQEWQASFSGKVGAELTAGMKLLALKASLSALSGELGRGNAIGISRTYSEDGETLTLTSEVTTDASLKVECGITGKLLEAELVPAKIQVGGQAKTAATYGLNFPNYSSDDGAQNMAVAAFFLGEIIEANPASLYLDPLYRALAEKVYDPSFCTVIDGSSASLGASAGGNLGALKINDVSVFPGLGSAEGETSVTVGIRKDNAGETKKTTNYLTAYDLCDNANNLTGSLGVKLMGKDTTISVTKNGSGTTLEASSLRDTESGFNHFILGECYSSDYDTYLFRDDALRELKSTVKNVEKYVDGNRPLMTQKDTENIANFVATSKLPLPYDRKVKEQILRSYSLELGLGAGLVANAGVTLSYLTSTDYSSATGFAKDDKIWLSAESIELQGAVNSRKEELGEFILNAMKSVAGLAADIFDTFVGSVKEGVDGAVSWVTGAADSAHNWVITIVSGQKDTAACRTMSVYTSRMATNMSAGVTTSDSGTQVFAEAATIGIATVLTVTDGDTGAEITDLSAQPLKYTMSYTEEDLIAAGLSSQSEVVRNGGIAMYRYDEELECFAFVGGSHDPERRTVTADIVQPGQYILMVDACAPTISALQLSDFYPTPTITASIHDQTGLDQSCFVFCVDGEEKITAENLSAHYNGQTGRFTYTVPENEALAEGEHVLSFTLRDLTGNTDTYEYRFRVDTTAPVIVEMTADGNTNAGSAVQIRAQIQEENLFAVYAVLAKRLPGGLWSETASVPMGDMGDGLWGLDYEGDGSSVRIYVQAVDHADHVTNSETLTVHAELESFALTQDYLVLKPGQTVQMEAHVLPATLAEFMRWMPEAETNVIAVTEDGEVTAREVGTAYIIGTVSDGGTERMVRCRIDVAATEAESDTIEMSEVQLSTNKVTTELYKDAFTTFEILLDLPQNHPVDTLMISDSATNAVAGLVHKSNIIDSVQFKTISDLFELQLLDDRTVQIVPTQKAMDSGKTVKSSYSDTVIVTVNGKTYESEKLTLSVKKTLPKVKAKIGAFNSFYEGQAQEIVITGGDVTGIRANENKNTGKTVAIPAWLTLENGYLKLNGETPKSSDKAYLWVDVEGWRVPAELTLSVKHAYKAPTLKLSATSVTLNTLSGDEKAISVTSNFADYIPDDLEVTGTAGDALTIEKQGNGFTVSTNENTAPNKSYKITVKTANPKIKAVTLTVKTVGKDPIMNALKVKGTMDVNFPGNKATIGVTLKDYADVFVPTLTIKDSTGNDVTSQFNSNWNGTEFEVTPNGAVKGTYMATVNVTIDMGEARGNINLEKTAKLTVKETLPKVKLSSTKVTLNKKLGNSTVLGITSATKGYELDHSRVEITAPEQIKAEYEEGRLKVSLNESAVYGKTYKVSVRAYAGASAVTLNVAVPAENKSNVTATIKASGFIDVIRDGSAITVTPTFTNAYASDMESMELKIYKRNGKVWDDVTVDAPIDVELTEGKYIVTAKNGLVHTDKYQAELVAVVGGKEIVSKRINLSIKMGSAKLVIKSSDTTLFAKDRNDRALVWFEAADLTLNDVKKIEIKDTKYKDAFEIIDYQDGTFAIGFKDGKLHKEVEKLIAKKASATITLNLNVFIDGNESTKINTTQKVKLTIVK